MAEAARAISTNTRTYGTEFFPYAPDVNERITKWAKERGVRVLSVIPIYHEMESYDPPARP